MTRSSETNVSGSIEVADRELERLIQKIENGDSEGLLVPYTDRFARDVIEGMLAYRRIALAGGRLIGAMDGLDSSSPGAKEIFRYRMVTAEAFLDRVKSNYQAAIDAKIARRAHIYKTPFGYRKDEAGRLVVYETEAKLVRELFERRSAGDDNGRLMRFLHDEGAVNSYTGKPFTKSGVRSIISNRSYLGEISIQNGKKGPRVITGYHPPIVSPALFETANAVKGAFHPRDRSLRDQVRLRGLVRCVTCERRLRVNGYAVQGKRVAVYSCTAPGCPGRVSIRADRLDRYVEYLVMQAAVDKEPHVAAAIEGDTRHAEALSAVENAQRLHDELRDDVDAQSMMGTKDWLAALKVRKEALFVARAHLAKVRPKKPRRETDRRMTFEAFLDEYEQDSNARLIDRVVVKPNPNGFGGAPVDPAQRADVYFSGASKPYRPKYGKVSKKDQALIDQHVAASR